MKVTAEYQAEESFEAFRDRVNLILVIDHAGRAGNGFFQTIFDQHPEVIVCPWLHYVYSYIVTDYGAEERLSARATWEHWRNSLYFSLLYNDLDEAGRNFVRKFGGDPDAVLDRHLLRQCLDEILLKEEEVARRDLICATYYSYARALGRDTRGIRYLMCTDQITLRFENALDGFSGQVVDLALNDFPEARIIHLERDPRAGIASTNHQFVNQLGNMYGLKLGNFCQRLGRLLRGELDWDSVFVFGFWLIFFRQAYEAIMRKRAQHGDRFTTVRNEDLNLNFADTMAELAGKLGIARLGRWSDNFQPTMIGRPWTGTGAYNSRYQTHRYGPLRNDPDKVARQVTGPNAYVTQRWRDRLGANEIFLVEALLAPELRHFGYKPLYCKDGAPDERRLRQALWKPLKGELPSLRWLLDGRHVGVRDLADRIFYCFVFPVFYVASRVVFASLIRRTKIFKSS